MRSPIIRTVATVPTSLFSKEAERESTPGRAPPTRRGPRQRDRK